MQYVYLAMAAIVLALFGYKNLLLQRKPTNIFLKTRRNKKRDCLNNPFFIVIY